MAKFNLDLRTFFARESKTIIAAYKNLIARRQGIKLDSAPHNAPSTIKVKGFDHWLVSTGETKNKGFESDYTKTKLRVFASKKLHSGRYKTARGTKRKKSPPSYEKIFEMHNAVGYSGVFQELPVGSKTIEKMNKEIFKQVNEHIKKHFPKRIKIKK